MMNDETLENAQAELRFTLQNEVLVREIIDINDQNYNCIFEEEVQTDEFYKVENIHASDFRLCAIEREAHNLPDYSGYNLDTESYAGIIPPKPFCK